MTEEWRSTAPWNLKITVLIFSTFTSGQEKALTGKKSSQPDWSQISRDIQLDLKGAVYNTANKLQLKSLEQSLSRVPQENKAVTLDLVEKKRQKPRRNRTDTHFTTHICTKRLIKGTLHCLKGEIGLFYAFINMWVLPFFYLFWPEHF